MGIQEKVSEAIMQTFDELSTDFNAVYDTSHHHTVGEWYWIMDGQVAASGVGSGAVPGYHLAAIGVDMLFLMNRMSTAVYGIGAIKGYNRGFQNVLDGHDFARVLIWWSSEEDGIPGEIAKQLATDRNEVLGAEVGLKLVESGTLKSSPAFATYFLGKKIGGKAGYKLSGKLGAKAGAVAGKIAGKVAAKYVGGIIPVVGAAIGGGINVWLLHSIMKTAEKYFEAKCDAIAKLK